MFKATTNRLGPIILALGVISVPAAGNAAHPLDDGAEYLAKAKVTSVQPIVRVVQVSTPREVCWDEPIRQTNHGHRRHRRSFVPTVLGGIIGGVVGNKFGSGRGKDAMTVAGALLGASVGRDSGDRRQHYQNVRYESGRHCEIEESVHEEERIEGYRVGYRFQGRNYVTRMFEKPGKSIRVRVQVATVD